jgi:putative colanic acid biosynthesis acetyltransferase WcaF
VQLWWVVQTLLFHSSPQFLYAWRVFLLRCFGAKIGKGVKIRPSASITYPWKLSIGDYSWIGDDVVLYTLGNIWIGRSAVVSQKSYLCTGSHDMGSAEFTITEAPITIEDQCWLAADVLVCPGVTVGFGTVVAARSTVVHDLPAGVIAYGTPAKPGRLRAAPPSEDRTTRSAGVGRFCV